MDATKPAKMIHWASGNTMNVNVVSLVHDVCNMNQKNNIQFRITGHSSIKLLTSLFILYDILLARLLLLDYSYLCSMLSISIFKSNRFHQKVKTNRLQRFMNRRGNGTLSVYSPGGAEDESSSASCVWRIAFFQGVLDLFR